MFRVTHNFPQISKIHSNEDNLDYKAQVFKMVKQETMPAIAINFNKAIHPGLLLGWLVDMLEPALKWETR